MTLVPSTCPLDCPDACGVLVETDERGSFVRVKGNPAHGFSRGALCGKTSLYGEIVHHPDRLLAPRVRTERGGWREVSWEEAYGTIAKGLERAGQREVLAAYYGGTMGLVQRKFPLRAMHALSAVFVDDGLCDHTATIGYRCVLGDAIGPDIEELDGADFLLLWGCDAARTHQHLQPALQRLCKRGVEVVAIDIYRTDTIRALERWGGRGLVIAPGSDAALALSMARLAFEQGLADREFLASQCLGAGEFERHVRSGYDLGWAERITGASAAEIQALSLKLAAAGRPFIKTGVGWTRRRTGAMSMRAVCSMAAVYGCADRVHYESADFFKLATDTVERPDLHPHVRSSGSPPPTIHHVEMGRELESGRFGAVFVWCHNPAVTVPQSRAVRAGLARPDVFVCVHEHFMTETAELADVVLPATTFVEHSDVYRSYGHRWVHYAKAACASPEGPRSNVAAFGGLARALGLPEATWDQNEDALCEELLRASTPRLGAAALERLLAGEPVKLAPRDAPRFVTPSGKVELWSSFAVESGEQPMAIYVADDTHEREGEHWIVCAPSRFTHNSTFAHSGRHRAREGSPRCHVHPEDAREKGLREGFLALLENSFGRLTLPVAISSDMPRGIVRVDGLPAARDLPEGVGVNALISPSLSDHGGGNSLYSNRIRLSKAVPQPHE